MVQRVRDSYGDPVTVVSIPATDLRRGDIIRMASDSLRIEETPILEGARVKIVARSAKEAGGMVRRSYLASKVFDVERAETSTHHATKKSPAQLQREIDEVLAKPVAPSSEIKLPPGAPAAWAHRHLSKANTPDKLAEIWRAMRKPGTGMGAYYASRTGSAQSEIHLVYQQHRARLGAA